MVNKENLLNNLRQELRKGTLVLAVLSQLNERHYGYSLVEKLNDLGLKIDQNSLYPLLRRLEKNELLTSSWDLKEPRPRKYYTLNTFGAEVLKELTIEWKGLNDVVTSILKEAK